MAKNSRIAKAENDPDEYVLLAGAGGGTLAGGSILRLSADGVARVVCVKLVQMLPHASHYPVRGLFHGDTPGAAWLSLAGDDQGAVVEMPLLGDLCEIGVHHFPIEVGTELWLYNIIAVDIDHDGYDDVVWPAEKTDTVLPVQPSGWRAAETRLMVDRIYGVVRFHESIDVDGDGWSDIVGPRGVHFFRRR